MFRLCRKQMAPPYSDTARRLAQQLAEKASRNLRQSGWAIDIDASGRFCAHRPSEQGDPPTQRRRLACPETFTRYRRITPFLRTVKGAKRRKRCPVGTLDSA